MSSSSIQCEYYALEGLGQLLRNVELVRANLNPDLRIGGIVLTMYDGRTRLALQVVDEVRKHFTDVVYQTVVPRSVRLARRHPGTAFRLPSTIPCPAVASPTETSPFNSRSEVACSRRPEKEQVDATSWWPWPWTGRPDPEQPRNSRDGRAGRRPGTGRPGARCDDLRDRRSSSFHWTGSTPTLVSLAKPLPSRCTASRRASRPLACCSRSWCVPTGALPDRDGGAPGSRRPSDRSGTHPGHRSHHRGRPAASRCAARELHRGD